MEAQYVDAGIGLLSYFYSTRKHAMWTHIFLSSLLFLPYCTLYCTHAIPVFFLVRSTSRASQFGREEPCLPHHWHLLKSHTNEHLLKVELEDRRSWNSSSRGPITAEVVSWHKVSYGKLCCLMANFRLCSFRSKDVVGLCYYSCVWKNEVYPWTLDYTGRRVENIVEKCQEEICPESWKTYCKAPK